MTLTNLPLTPIGRLENLSDRVGNLRQRADGLRGREHYNRVLRGDLAAVRRLLDRVDREIADALGRVHTLGRFGYEMSEEAKAVAAAVDRVHRPWLDYAATRLDAANIAFLTVPGGP